jgi:hypothetical protein
VVDGIGPRLSALPADVGGSEDLCPELAPATGAAVAFARHGCDLRAYAGGMAEDENVIAPPPMRQGVRSTDAPVSPALQLPRSTFWPTVWQGFQLGLGIAAAFAVLSAVFWLLVAILMTASLG